MAVLDRLAVGAIEDVLRGGLRCEHSHLHLGFNDHSEYLVSAASEYADGDNDPDELWVSASERDKALGLDSVWTLQWFPASPGKPNLMRASSLPALLAWVADHGIG